MRYNLDVLYGMVLDNSVQTEIEGKWVPARPIGWRGFYGFRRRVKDAWAVIRDEVDVIVWPGGQ